MKLTDEEKAMRDGRDGNAVARAMDLLIRYGEALGAEDFVETRNVCGTVTATTSVRYGDISGPPRAHQLELRASWTATTPEVGVHVEAFCEVLEHAAGLPPAGVTDLGSRSRA